MQENFSHFGIFEVEKKLVFFSRLLQKTKAKTNKKRRLVPVLKSSKIVSRIPKPNKK